MEDAPMSAELGHNPTNPPSPPREEGDYPGMPGIVIPRERESNPDLDRWVQGWGNTNPRDSL